MAGDLWAFTTTPTLGLAGTGWLIVRPEGTITFEGAPFYDAASRDRIAALDGVTWLSGSHAHGYGTSTTSP